MGLLSWIKTRGNSGELMVLKELLWGAVVKEEYQTKRTVNSVLDASTGLSMGCIYYL